MKKSLIPVTDHAVLRYLERVEGVDVERVRREIGRRVDRAVNLGASGTVIEGFHYVISDEGAVVTVIEPNRPDRRVGRQRKERPE